MNGVRMRSKVEVMVMVMVVVGRGYWRLVSGGMAFRKAEDSYGDGRVCIRGNPCPNSQWRCI